MTQRRFAATAHRRAVLFPLLRRRRSCCTATSFFLNPTTKPTGFFAERVSRANDDRRWTHTYKGPGETLCVRSSQRRIRLWVGKSRSRYREARQVRRLPIGRPDVRAFAGANHLKSRQAHSQGFETAYPRLLSGIGDQTSLCRSPSRSS